MESSSENLPPIASLSPSVISFLNYTFQPTHDLLNLCDSNRLVSELETQCSHLSQLLSDLMQRLDASLVSYSSFSDRIGASFNKSHSELEDLKFKLSPFASTSDSRGEKIVAQELAALAKEVARVEMVRKYAETALKLDSLVGEVEDAVSSVMSKNFNKYSIAQSPEELLVSAIDSLKFIEDVLASVTKAHPQWVRLISAADQRVDRALATLRPQAIADHRALIALLGWPPPLSTLSSSNLDTRRPYEMSNPLSELRGEFKKKYCESFTALCSLQELQQSRKSRQLQGYSGDVALHQPLWAIEELVNPLSLASHHHFKSWLKKPEFIFALVYKLIRDYIDSIDELLQPLVDEAMLKGYSCREEWISAMITSLTTYLAKEIFPSYVAQLNEESVTDVQQSRLAWLHLIDLMISFDKRIHDLVSHSGILVSVEDYSLLQRISSLSVFADRPDWLDMWAEIELGSILDILKPEMEDERNWTTKTHGAVPFLGSEDYKSPGISSLFLRHVSSVIDRCRSLPTLFLRSRFIRSVGAPIIQALLNSLLTKCLEAEGLTALADDDALTRVLTSINCARHLESVLKEWCEDVFFLEMGLAPDDESGKPFTENSLFTGVSEGVGNGVFDDEIQKMEEFRKEWIDKITNVVLRGFDSQIRGYLKNRKQWQEKLEEGWTVTPSFVVAMDYLQGKMSIIELGLNGIDFAAVWRNLARGIDRVIYTGILTNNAKFSRGGIERFGGDMDVLFGVFRTWCLRPEGFFPHVSEGLKLLKMEENHLQGLFNQGEEWMKNNGIRHFSVAEAEKMARCRVFL
uniref:RINT1-like protein MAG2 n=1 Tax=Opuntia streptacantha TaxID=393608 RepID=A0A7C8YRW2_OPUST